MAKQVKNGKGFLIIETTLTEMARIGSLGICDSCNKGTHKGYYIAVLNSWYCPECYNEWQQRAERYDSDSDIEKKNFAFYADLLNMEEK